MCPSPSIQGLHKCFWSSPPMPKKLLIFNMNGVVCYFPKCVVLQGNRYVRGNNIDINTLESKARMQKKYS